MQATLPHQAPPYVARRLERSRALRSLVERTWATLSALGSALLALFGAYLH